MRDIRGKVREGLCKAVKLLQCVEMVGDNKIRNKEMKTRVMAFYLIFLKCSTLFKIYICITGSYAIYFEMQSLIYLK